MVRTLNCSDKLKDQWDQNDKYDDDDEEEEDKIVVHASKNQEMPVQRRNGKGSKEKWSGGNWEPDVKHRSFTPQEEELVIQLHSAIGSRWPIIAQQLPGRTENDVKTLWNSKLRKKLSAMGIDPVTHKPFSQILADYGSIGAFPKARTRFASLSRDLKNATMLRSHLASTNPSDQYPSPSDGARVEPLDQRHSSIDLYSQLQAVNLVADTAANTTKNEPEFECGSSYEISSSNFSWSDFLLEDEMLPPDGSNGHENATKGGDKAVLGHEYCGEMKKNSEGGGLDNNNNKNGFEGGSCSESSSFVEAMLESQDEMFAQLSGFFGEPFYY